MNPLVPAHRVEAAAHGVFQVYERLDDLTTACFLNDTSVRTPVFVRFSTMARTQGASDSARDARVFATKFYTNEGEFDLVGNNVPVSFMQDAVKVPVLVHAEESEQDHPIGQASTEHDRFWDFVSLMPESTHMVMWMMSDRVTPRSYRMMEGFGVHSFRMINSNGACRLIKFHWKPLAGVHGLVWDEALKLSGNDPDFHQRDLADAIDAGNFPEWELGVQVVEKADAARLNFDLLDVTKLIPEELVPVRRIGKMTLNRNPTAGFPEARKVVFLAENMVPGIDVGENSLLQGRMISERHVDRDGLHPPCTPFKVRRPAEPLSDHYSQARLFWQSQTPVEQQHIVRALQFELGKLSMPAVQQRVLSNLVNVDRYLAARVAVVLGMPVPAPSSGTAMTRYASSPSLSMIARGNPTATAGRSVAILAADGVNADQVQAMKVALRKVGVTVRLLASRRGDLTGIGGVRVPVDDLILARPSVVFDAVFVPGGTGSVNALRNCADAVHFVREAFKHAKPISAQAQGVDFLIAAGVTTSPMTITRTAGLSTGDDSCVLSSKFIADIAEHRHWARDKLDMMAA